ncbi:MAG UNVERIFIED_CONTAM: hypothetical protein LVR29_03720 [Microcystis novacekii LVE1205-3]
MDERCDRFKPVAKSTIRTNLLAVNYLESLGQLAGDQRVSLNQNLTDSWECHYQSQFHL